jgi:SAM-dependent methyltransferase
VSASEERLGVDPTSELWGEHRARYRFASQLAADQRVLDIASGSGYGLEMLREAGACAIGIDYDVSALRAPGRVVCADAAHLPVRDGCFDLITSFETLEHVPDARAMVYELRRVLRRGGRLVLSTPNRAFRESNNPFHIQEFTADELRSLLCEVFGAVTIYGQWPSPLYRYVPVLMLERRWELAELSWKLLNRLPYGVKDNFAFVATGRGFYPSEYDWHFRRDDYDGAHTLLAVAE